MAGICGWRHGAQRTSLMLRSHRNWAFFNTPTRCGYQLGFRATPSIPTSKRSSSCSFQEKDGPAAGRFAGASIGWGGRGLSSLLLCLQAPPGSAGASRGLQGPPGASRSFQPFQARFSLQPFAKLSGQILGGFPAPGPPGAS